LTTITAFFPQSWSQPVQQGLSEDKQAWLLGTASFYLMSLGRLAESVEPRKASLKLLEKLEDWKNVSATARNLVELYLPLGRLSDAEQAARQAIDYAEKAEDLFMKIVTYATLATCLHRQGKLEEALQFFQISEQILQKYNPSTPKLYSIWGFQYCALLLDKETEIRQVLIRGKNALKAHEKEISRSSLLDFSLSFLTLARCYQALNDLQQAQDYFNQAVTGIRKAGKTNHLCYFLIDRANFYLQQQQLEAAKHDLNEADMMIKRGDMKLYAVDWHLAMRDYERAMQNETAALEHQRTAKALIDVTGYKLRLNKI